MGTGGDGTSPRQLNCTMVGRLVRDFLSGFKCPSDSGTRKFVRKFCPRNKGQSSNFSPVLVLPMFMMWSVVT